MSCNYYFEKWKRTLDDLVELIRLDFEYQDTRVHDKQWCEAVQRLSGILGQYMFIYNETADCCLHNLQVQKAGYMTEIAKALVARILELKHQLRKLIGTEHLFMGHGLIDQKLTTFEIELSNVIPKPKRDENIRTLVWESIQKAEDRKRRSIISVHTELPEPEEKESQKVNWWENDNDAEDGNDNVRKGINVAAVYELVKTEELTEEMLEERKMVTLIQAQERSRQLTLTLIQQKQNRERWEKELKGTLQPPAKYELREKSAKIIQRIFRAYFETKRKRLQECKRDEILAIGLCEKRCPKDTEDGVLLKCIERFNEYDRHWKENYDRVKEKYIKRKHDATENDIRDEIMYWFRQWFDEASVFHEMPKESEGGSILIVKEEIPSPREWLQQYEAYLETKRANKNKTAYELKNEKLEKKKEQLLQKKIENTQKKMEEKILKKMMKNPKFHPGYHYPESKHKNYLLQTIEKYKTHWSSLDFWEEAGVKEKYVADIDVDNACMDAKLEIRKTVDVAMRETFNVLNKALIEDYKRNGEQMPEQIKEKTKGKKKRRKRNIEAHDDIADKLENLAYRGFLKEYLHVKIEDFIGDPNFAGDDLQSKLQVAEAFSAETRALWWERCRELSHNSHRILLVGAKGSGKTTLVYALATANDAVLYEIDPSWIPEELVSALYLQELASSVAACARATQPSVIYIRHVHRLYYRKPPKGEDVENLNLIKRYLLKKLLKKVHKTDKITIAASCMDPWLASTKQMVKQFPSVVLLPNTNYSTVILILNKWISDNQVIPRDLDIQSLARALQGYPFGHIKDTLNKFLSADRIIKIAAYGLPLHDILECFLDGEEVKVDYNKYLKWYNDKTFWGKKAKKILEDQKEFHALVEKWEQKKKKKKIVDNSISDTSISTDNQLYETDF